MKPEHERRRWPASLLLAALIAGYAGASRPASAHPHVWVAVEVTVAYESGSVAGLRHRWAFDEMYTAMAIQGLDKNGDGNYDRDELADLAKINIEGLKEFGYFTVAKLGAGELSLGDPKDYWLEYKDGVLALHFTLPLASPVPAEAEGFSFSVYDPSYFIAFDLAKEQPIKIAEGAPAGCTASVGVPKAEAAEAQALGDAFANELGGTGYGLGMAKTVSVSCPKS